MPPVSQAQRKWGYWTEEGKNPNTPPSVGAKFLGHGIHGLPARVSHGKPVIKAVSFKQAARGP